MSEARLVLVHGAWHQPWVWTRAIQQLPACEVDVVEPPSSTPGVMGDLDADVLAVRHALTRSDGPVVVVAHSYAGIPASAAAAGLTSVAHLVYLAAFLPSPGDSLMTLVGTDQSWWDRDAEAGVIRVVDPLHRVLRRRRADPGGPGGESPASGSPRSASMAGS